MIPDSPLDLLNRITPVQCVAIARRLDRRGVPITIAEIASRSGMSIQRATWIGRQSSWGSVSVGQASAFMAACGVTLRNHALQLRYIRNTSKRDWPMAHLARLSWKQRKSLLTKLS